MNTLPQLYTKICKAEARKRGWLACGLTAFTETDVIIPRGDYDHTQLLLDMRRAEDMGITWVVGYNDLCSFGMASAVLTGMDGPPIARTGPDPEAALALALNAFFLSRLRLQVGLPLEV